MRWRRASDVAHGGLNAMPSGAVATFTIWTTSSLSVSMTETVLAPLLVMNISLPPAPKATPWLPRRERSDRHDDVVADQIDLLDAPAAVVRDVGELLVGRDHHLDGPRIGPVQSQRSRNPPSGPPMIDVSPRFPIAQTPSSFLNHSP